MRRRRRRGGAKREPDRAKLPLKVGRYMAPNRPPRRFAPPLLFKEGKKRVFALAFVFLSPFQTSQPYGIGYRLAMSHPASHLFEVAIDVSIPANETATFVDFQIPLWQPGRYSVADFAKNVQEFDARSQGRALQWTKIDNQTWRVQRQGNRAITATYKVFGDDLSGTYAQLNAGHASYTGGELFMYIVGHKPDAVQLHVDAPPDWHVVNGHTERADQRDWKYSNYEDRKSVV